MNRLKPRLTYANIVATLALCIAVAGSSAVAASHLGKNTVGPKKLKKNAVVTAKVKNEAITAAKVKKGTLTGAQINTSTLGTVPNATTSNTAKVANLAVTSAPPERWHEVTDFDVCHVGPNTDWENYGEGFPQAAYYRDPLGIVRLRGSVKCPGGPPGVGYTFFKLPAGFRPDGILYALLPAEFTANIASALILSSGAVNYGGPASLSGQHFALDTISFRCGPSGVNGCP